MGDGRGAHSSYRAAQPTKCSLYSTRPVSLRRCPTISASSQFCDTSLPFRAGARARVRASGQRACGAPSDRGRVALTARRWRCGSQCDGRGRARPTLRATPHAAAAAAAACRGWLPGGRLVRAYRAWQQSPRLSAGPWSPMSSSSGRPRPRCSRSSSPGGGMARFSSSAIACTLILATAQDIARRSARHGRQIARGGGASMEVACQQTRPTQGDIGEIVGVVVGRCAREEKQRSLSNSVRRTSRSPFSPALLFFVDATAALATSSRTRAKPPSSSDQRNFLQPGVKASSNSSVNSARAVPLPWCASSAASHFLREVEVHFAETSPYGIELSISSKRKDNDIRSPHPLGSNTSKTPPR